MKTFFLSFVVCFVSAICVADNHNEILLPGKVISIIRNREISNDRKVSALKIFNKSALRFNSKEIDQILSYILTPLSQTGLNREIYDEIACSLAFPQIDLDSKQVSRLECYLKTPRKRSDALIYYGVVAILRIQGRFSEKLKNEAKNVILDNCSAFPAYAACVLQALRADAAIRDSNERVEYINSEEKIRAFYRFVKKVGLASGYKVFVECVKKELPIAEIFAAQLDSDEYREVVAKLLDALSINNSSEILRFIDTNQCYTLITLEQADAVMQKLESDTHPSNNLNFISKIIYEKVKNYSEWQKKHASGFDRRNAAIAALNSPDIPADIKKSALLYLTYPVKQDVINDGDVLTAMEKMIHSVDPTLRNLLESILLEYKHKFPENNKIKELLRDFKQQ